MGLVDHHHDALAPLGLLGGKGIGGLGDEGGLVEAGHAAERADYGEVQAPRANRRVAGDPELLRINAGGVLERVERLGDLFAPTVSLRQMLPAPG